MRIKIPLFAIFLVFVTIILIPVKHFNQIDCFMTNLPDEDLFGHAPQVDGFDFPVGPPDANGYYVARAFRDERHLGEDWNGLGGRDTDLGDTVYAIGNGIVIFSKNCGSSWGNIIRIVHNTEKYGYVESLYAHLKELYAEAGARIYRGDPIGTMGNANGKYFAHLHLELRTTTSLPIAKGYSEDSTGYTNPTHFILANRPIQE